MTAFADVVLDEKVIEAVDDEWRDPADVVKRLLSQLAAVTAEFERRGREIDSCYEQLVDLRDERDSAMRDRDSAIATRDATTATNTRLIAQVNELMLARDAALRERDAANERMMESQRWAAQWYAERDAARDALEKTANALETLLSAGTSTARAKEV